MKKLIAVALLSFPFIQTHAQLVIFDQPVSPSGGLLMSSWSDPDGSDFDRVIWDNFTLDSSQSVTGIKWTGGHDPARASFAGGPVQDFTVAIYPSNLTGTQPDLLAAPLVSLNTGGNAGETAAGVIAGTSLYHYSLALPAPFQAEAGTKYWVQIQASQSGIPDWGFAVATGGDGTHFGDVLFHGTFTYDTLPGDAAFSLTAVPEPASAGWAGLALAGFGLGWALRRRSGLWKTTTVHNR